MRRIQSLLMALLVAATASATDKVINLPKPNLNRTGGTVMKALSERHSTREYASKELSLADLSDLLWAANGVNRPDGKRTAPSALNKQDVDIYVITSEGGYLYDAKEHRLTLVAEGDFRGKVAGGQSFVKEAPLCLVLVSDVSRFGDAGNAQNQLMGAVDAGIVSQNISLFCSFANLATVPRASMDTDGLREALSLKEGQLPLMNHPVGYFK